MNVLPSSVSFDFRHTCFTVILRLLHYFHFLRSKFLSQLLSLLLVFVSISFLHVFELGVSEHLMSRSQVVLVFSSLQFGLPF